MSISKRILFVDDDSRLCQAAKRRYRHRYELETASDAEEAMRTLESGTFAVAVCNHKLPEDTGIELLERIKEKHPDTVRVLMASQLTTEIAVDAVNRSSIFRFLVKPTTTRSLCLCFDESLRHYELQQLENKYHDETLRGCVEILTEVLAKTNPIAYARTKRLRALVRQFMETMRLPESWACETAALLSQMGWLGLPPILLAKRDSGITLADEEKQVIDGIPDVAASLIRKIPRFETIAHLIEAAHDISLAETDKERTYARILALCSDLDRRLARGIPLEEAILQTYRATGDLPEAMATALEQIEELEALDAPFTIAISSAKSGWTLDQDLVTKDGIKLLGNGHVLSGSALVRLRSYVKQGRLEDFVQVRNSSQPQAA